MSERNSHLVAKIARQRSELADAYRELAKPIQYAEYGMRGFGFLRQNPWVLTLGPAVFSIVSSAVAIARNKPPKGFKSLFTDKAERGARRTVEKKAERETKGILSHAVKWGGHGLKLFKLYRNVRKFLP